MFEIKNFFEHLDFMKPSLSLYNKSHKIKISEGIKKLFKSKLQMKKL